MLLTYEENANIPDKIHLFYNKAFETLFHKHDALKEQYERSRRSNLQIDDFTQIFSVFCLHTYVKEKTEFLRSELFAYVKDAIKYCGASVKPDDFIFDMKEAVCLINQEGQSYFFIHRSFQEYFTAYFLSNCPEDVRDQFIDKVCTRYWDNVLPMLFDMSKSQIEPSWVTQNCDTYLGEVGFHSGKLHPVLSHYNQVIFYKIGDEIELLTLGTTKFAKFLIIMRRFYFEEFEALGPIMFENSKDLVLQLPGFAEEEKKAELEELSFAKRKGKVITVSLDEKSFDWMKICGMFQRGEMEFQIVSKIRERISNEIAEKEAFLKRLFTNNGD